VRPAWSPDGRSLLTVFTPEADPAQTYLLAVAVRGQAGSTAHTMAAFGGLMRLQAASWTGAALPGGASASEPAAPRALNVGAWLGQGMTDDAFGSATRHADALDMLSPYWYTVNWRGELTHYLTADDPEFVRFAHTHGLALYPTLATQDDLSNLRGVLQDPARRERHIRAIVQTLETHGYDGIDLDFEGLTVDDRDALSGLARELALVLRAEGLGLSVTVYPKANDGQTWIGPGANDYIALGQVADQVRIMAYEFHSGGGPAGPVGPLYWQEQVLDYAIARIPPEKIVLGLHLYGRDWGSGGSAVLYRDIDQTRRSTGARAQWDQEAAESYFTYYSGGVLHRVWYPDALFVAVRVQLAQRYGISGLYFWRLGGEDETLWDMFDTKH
jgi:spore germination protein YaaH